MASVRGGLLVDEPPKVVEVAKLGEREEGVELEDDADEETGEWAPAEASDMSTLFGSSRPNELRFALRDVEAD